MVKLNILKSSHGFVDESDVNIWLLLPATSSKIEIDECTLLGSSRTHIGKHNKS